MNTSRVRAATRASTPTGESEASRRSDAGPQVDATKRTKSDRRSNSQSGLARSYVGSGKTDLGEDLNIYSLIGTDFVFTAPIFAVAALVTFLMTGIVPSIAVAVLIIAAIAIMALSRKSLTIERQFADNLPKQLGMLYFVVGGPMFLSGLAFSIWTQGGPIQAVLIAGCSCLVASVVAIMALHGRLPSMAVVITGITTGGILLPAPFTCAAIILVSVIGEIVLAARYQKRIREAERKRIASQRRQIRAESLIAEFEQSGQGWF